MNEFDAYEQAYQNGYKRGKQDALIHAHWIISSDGYYPYCSNCKTEPKGQLSKFCPNCGAAMDEEANNV